MPTNDEIKVFGDKAKAIKTGDLFRAEVGSVEGRTVATLAKLEKDALEELWRRYSNE
jgi:hypothetical protein